MNFFIFNAEVCVLQPSNQVTDPEQETYGDRVHKRNETFDLIYKEPLLMKLEETPVTLKPLGLSVREQIRKYVLATARLRFKRVLM